MCRRYWEGIMLTVVDLAFRSMRKNIKHYYLYFFALIFSTSLYYIFSSLQHDHAVQEMASESVDFFTAFQVAGILLIVIVSIFTVYANRIFLKRRSREIGLYQLIGLSKGWVARYLIIENTLLGLGALLIGIVCGALLSRLFLLILMKLLGLEGVLGISINAKAIFMTVLVFLIIIVFTSIQVLLSIYRTTLLDLFQADKQQEHPNKPRPFLATVMALLGISLIGFGYQLSGHMLNDQLFLNMLLVLSTTIAGTYLVFRVTISWGIYWFRKRKNGLLGLYNSLSLAPLMHRMRSNASSLTLITVLSAMAITLVSIAYSLYYTVEQDTRLQMPYDFLIENREQEAEAFRLELEQEGIDFQHGQVEALRIKGSIHGSQTENDGVTRDLLWLPAEQLIQTGKVLKVPSNGEVIFYNARANIEAFMDVNTESSNQDMWLELQGKPDIYPISSMILENIINYNVYGLQLLASETTIDEIREQTEYFEEIRFDTFLIPNKQEREQASSIYEKYVPKDSFMPDFYSEYQNSLQKFGLLIFISAFLGLAFLIATGSILYFKQMTEAEQEKQSFKTLRQLGFDVNMIMKGIARKQAFVFFIPLLIGLLHSWFAVKAASILVISSITVPTITAMGMYALIYFIFAVLTLRYYRKIVKSQML